MLKMSTNTNQSTTGNNNQDVSDMNILWDKIRKEVNTSEPKVKKDGKQKKKKLVNMYSTPTMVFSVIGNSDSFVPRPWPTTLFQTALIEAAKSGGETWILFRKNDEGLSNVIRNAYQHYEAMEFGKKQKDIGDPDRHIKLINIAGKEGNPQSNNLTEGESKAKKTLIEKKDVNIDESNTEEKDPRIYEINIGDDEIQMLKFEELISKQEVDFFSPKMEIKMPVPLAIIVCEGDLQTIDHISQALQKNIPVIIMKGSGKAADLVLDFIRSGEEIRKKASILFGIQFDKKRYEDLVKLLDTIKNYKDLVGEFDLDRDDPLMLSNIVGETVVSCWSTESINANDAIKHDPKKQQESIQNTSANANGLHLQENGHALKGFSLTWKLLQKNSICPDEAILNQSLQKFKRESRPYVLNPKYSTPTSLPLYFYFVYQLLQESKRLEECGPILLLEALKANRCDYVRVLLAKGVSFRKVDLPELYGQTVSCQDCKEKDDCLHMEWILNQIQKEQTKNLFKKYRKMTEKKEKAEEKGEQWIENVDKMQKLSKSVAEAAKELCCRILKYEKKESTETSTISDILLWAIYANRKELAEICWLRCGNHLLTGLLCSAILKKLSKKASNVKEQLLSNDLEQHSKMFEQRCIALMDSMYNENTKHAIEMMDDEAVVWGIHSSPLTFAYENFMYDIVAHTCSQKNMNKQWYNNLAPDLKPFFLSAFKEKRKFITAPLTKYLFNYGCLEAQGRSHRSYYSRMKRYLYDFWNVVDLLSYILLIAALFVRHFYIDETFTIARRMFALSLLVMYLRFLEVFLIHRKLGPTLIMIKEMLKDLLGFLSIAVFLVLGVGIYYHANLWPDHQSIWSGDWTNWRIWTIIYYPYWQLYGELNLDYLDGSKPDFEEDKCTNITSEWESDTSKERCPQEDWTVQAVAAFYLLFSNLLLVNLVIAMFSYTFERVQENSEKLWRFERYTVINDYDWRIPSPINLVFLPYRFLCCPAKENCCLHKCQTRYNKKKTEKKKEKKSNDMAFRRNLQKIIALRNHNKI
nr:transient receptor potential cation channel subfamily M member-like 2 isoform X2 [Crassostrea gigas]